MSARRLTISRDVSWLAFGCLVAMILVVAVLLIFGRVFSGLLSMGDRSSASELVVHNMSAATLILKVEDNTGARYYPVPVNKLTVIDTEGGGNPTPDFIRISGLDCASSRPVVNSDERGFSAGGTITVDASGAATFEAGHDMDSLGDRWRAEMEIGFPTCEDAANQ